MKPTVLNPIHRELNGRLVEFGGYEMPVQYTSILEEHRVVREEAGLFDLCHMGRYEIRGARSVEAVDAVITNHAARMKTGQIRYALVLNDEGGVRDDILVYRMPETVFLVVNAGNRDKLLAWFSERLTGPDAELVDRSEELAMIALQGPKAESLLAPHVETGWVDSLPELGYYRITEARVDLAGARFEGWISRTGYTGEDGFEIYLPSERAIPLWKSMVEVFGDRITPCGLGSRDTLRLEAGMPLYGHELDEDVNPYEAGLGFAVKLGKPGGFIGAEALRTVRAEGPARELRGYTVAGKRVARQGMEIFDGDRRVGRVTSGAPSPSLGRNVAMALLDRETAPDASLEVEIRGRRLPLKPHPLPFYKRN